MDLVWLQHPDSRGQYLNIDQDSGRVNYAIHVGGYTTHDHSTVADFVLYQARGRLDQWIERPFRRWQDRFARERPEQYNRLINLAPRGNHPSTLLPAGRG